MTVTAEVASAQLPELLKEIRAGNEVVLTEKNEPVAILSRAPRQERSGHRPSVKDIHVFHDVKVLTPTFTNAEIAEEMFGQK
jgi:antitoxin (DNA-binding transcriptional repressor) of toxin-antitoxin stability system